MNAIDNARNAPTPAPTLDYADPGAPSPSPNRLATAGLWCALSLLPLSALCFALGGPTYRAIGLALTVTSVVGPVACLFAIGGLVQSRHSSGRGKSRAAAALFIGLLGAVGGPLLLPSLDRPRVHSPEIKCASNLRQIGLGVLMYANENKGNYPARMEDILITQDLTSDVFICPSSQDQRATGDTKEAQAALFSTPGYLSYVYVGAGLNATAPPDFVLVYERPANHNNGGMNVLFADGHVEWVAKAQFQQMLATLAGAGGKPVRMTKAGWEVVEDWEP